VRMPCLRGRLQPSRTRRRETAALAA